MPHQKEFPDFSDSLSEGSDLDALESPCSETSNTDQQSIWVSQSNGEQLHLRYFKPAESNGRRVFMLHGEAESGRVYYGSQNRGLAHKLVEQGYEVFVADLAGRGRSLASREDNAPLLSIQDIITESIPRFLQAIANTPSELSEDSYYGCPADIWVGHGFGCVLLSAAWSRLPESARAASQMAFFSGRRQMLEKRGLGDMLLKGLSHPIMRKLVERADHFPAARLGLGSADESVGWYLDYTRWISSREWIGEDGFDYAQALATNPLPPVLHLVAQRDTLYSNLADVRHFIEELGPHDARVLCFDKSSQGKSYNHLSLLLSESANNDVFIPLIDWLGETGPVAMQSWMALSFDNAAQIDTSEIAETDQLVFA